MYFEVVSTLALIIGLLVVNLVRPGVGMNIDPATLDAKAVSQYVSGAATQGVTDFILAIVPNTVVDAFAKGEILQVLLFSVLFGFALHALGGAWLRMFDFIEQLSRVLFRLVGFIMKAAPLGAFGAMAFTIGNFGVGTLAQLGKLILCFYITCVLFVAVVLMSSPESTDSVSAPGPVYQGRDLHCLRHVVIGVGAARSWPSWRRSASRGRSSNIPAAIHSTRWIAIYLTIATVFIAQATNTLFGLRVSWHCWPFSPDVEGRRALPGCADCAC